MALPYPGWNVVYGATPTAAYWSQLGANDDALAAGTGFNSSAVIGSQLLSNPYKFRAYQAASQTTTANTFILVKYDAKTYDTSTNFDATVNKGRFTAPVAGFYHFDAITGIVGAVGTTELFSALYKNSSAISYGNDVITSAAAGGIFRSSVNDTIQLSAGDYVEHYVRCSGNVALDNSAPGATYFSGYLVSKV